MAREGKQQEQRVEEDEQEPGNQKRSKNLSESYEEGA
jgi:hypothetical protein